MTENPLELEGVSVGVNLGVVNLQANLRRRHPERRAELGPAPRGSIRALRVVRGKLKQSYLRALRQEDEAEEKRLRAKIRLLDAQIEELELRRE